MEPPDIITYSRPPRFALMAVNRFVRHDRSRGSGSGSSSSSSGGVSGSGIQKGKKRN